MYASSLIDQVRYQLGEAGGRLAAPAEAASLRGTLAAWLTDPRKRRGIRHPLASLTSVLIAGVACGYSGPLAIAQAAAGWDQQVLAAHGTRRNPATGLHEPPSASTLGRLPRLLDADELEAGLSAWATAAALDPQRAARIAARRAGKKDKKQEGRRRRKPPAAEALREVRGDGWGRAAPGHPWLDPAVTGDPHHVPARRAVAVDGKERKLAKAAGKAKVHLLAAVTHVAGLVIGQDKVAKSGKASEVTHFRPLLEPLPLDGVLVTADAMQTTRDNARFLREVKRAHYLVPILGQPARPVRRPRRPGLGEHPDRRRHYRHRPQPDRDPHHPRPARPGRPGLPRRQAGHPHRAVRHQQKERHLGDAQLRGRPVPHQP